MSLSKKNLAKLNIFKKNNKNLIDNINNYTKIDNNNKSTKNQIKIDDPNKIFYSLIDNSESLDETSKVNQSLRNSKISQININSKKANYSKKLSTEDVLYDEFNYLLDE